MRQLFELINKNLLIDKLRETFKKKIDTNELPLITISREMGSGGRPIAFLVAEKLGKPWKVFHAEIVDEIAKETNLEKRLIREVDETKLPLIDEVVADFFGKRYLNLPSYHKHLAKILSTIGHRGHAIIVGRGAHYLFPEALKIRIICEMEQRIKWEMEYEKISRSQAIARIEKSDNERKEFEKSLYNHDPRKAHHYDLVIRTGPDLSIEDASDLIAMMARRKFKF